MRRAAFADRGSAVVEFVLVVPLLVLVAAAVVQLALLGHARAVLLTAAGEGARAGALAGADPRAGEVRARALVDSALRPGLVSAVSGGIRVIDGLPVMELRLSARVPLLAPLGEVDLDVVGHALAEDSR
jgi:Flp pilus assembly protein TadG